MNIKKPSEEGYKCLEWIGLLDSRESSGVILRCDVQDECIITQINTKRATHSSREYC